MKKKLFMVFLVAVMLLNACGKEENKNETNGGTGEENNIVPSTGYSEENKNNQGVNIGDDNSVPVPDFIDESIYADDETPATGIEQLVNFDGFTVMDFSYRSYAEFNNGITGYNQNCFYHINDKVGFKLDFNTGILGEYCDVPDCKHDLNSPDCIYKTETNRKILTADGYYSFSGDTLYFTPNDGEHEEVYKNKYYNDYGIENYITKKTDMFGIIKENTAYLHGYGWIQKLSLDTLETTEPVDVEVFNLNDAVGDLWFSITEDSELYCYNLLNGEAQKIDNDVFSLMCTKDYVYYVRSEEVDYEWWTGMYRFAIDGTGEPELLIENTCVEFYVNDNNIFYAVENPEVYESGNEEQDSTIEDAELEKYGIFMCDADGRNPKKLDMSFSYKDGTEYKIENQPINCMFLFTSCDSIDYLFIMDNTCYTNEMSENALFIVNKKTGEVIPVSLGIFYQGDGYEGEYIDESGFTQYLQDSGHTLTY